MSLVIIYYNKNKFLRQPRQGWFSTFFCNKRIYLYFVRAALVVARI
jgi:hypothetical protein